MWDNTGTDPIRKIIGLSLKGGVAIYSGDLETNGSSIRLNSVSSTTQPVGSVQTQSIGSGATGVIAIEHLNYNTTTSTTQNLFSIDQDGNTRVTGKLFFDPLAGDVAFRKIEAHSLKHGIDIFTNKTGNPGTALHMTAPGHVAQPGLVHFSAHGPLLGGFVGLAYNLTTSFVAGTEINALQINNDGRSRFGNVAPPTKIDRLTVDGNLYVNTDDGTDIPRNILARSDRSVLNVTSGNNTDGSDGAALTENAKNVALPGEPGAFVIKSYGAPPSGNSVPLGFAYRNYEPANSSLHNIFLINNRGQGIFGHDVSIPNISGTDVFTVKNYLGFWAPSDSNAREIHGNTITSELGIYSNHGGVANGSAMELFGRSNTTNPGMLQFTSYGLTGASAVFRNYDPFFGYHTNVQIKNNGQTIIGKDVPVTAPPASDVLTVKEHLGFYSSSPGLTRTINGNAASGAFTINCRTGSANGPSIEMYGDFDPPTPWGEHRDGGLRYISNGTTGYGHLFMSYSPTASWQSRMAITNDGKVIIGSGLIDIANSHAPGNYNLYVEKGILTELVKVASTTGTQWADFVFAKNYQLMPLEDVENFVEENKHLPEIPSAKEVQEEGIDLAKMDAKLLQKIEELTLYVIQQQKEIDELKKSMKK